MFTSKEKSKGGENRLVNIVTALLLQMCFYFSLFMPCVCLCVCMLQYAGCHSYQNANLTASLLETTFTQKWVAFPPFVPPSTHLPVYLLFKTGSSSSCTPESLCVYTLYVCMLPWLLTGLTGVITSKPPSQQLKRDRKEVRAAQHLHSFSQSSSVLPPPPLHTHTDI